MLGPAKENPAPIRVKEWASLAISLAALGISAGSAYYNHFRQVDEIGVLIVSPTMGFHVNRPGFYLSGNARYVFVNSGNRAAVVYSNALVISHPRRTSRGGPCGVDLDDSRFIDTSLDRFLIKDKEVIAVDVSLIAPKQEREDYIKPNTQNEFFVEISEASKKRSMDPMKVCMAFNIVTPGGGFTVGAEIAEFNIVEQKISFREQPGDRDNETKLIPLLYRRE
jgi:hypothetical protein